MSSQIQRAHAALKKASETLMGEVKRAFPVGTVVTVQLGQHWVEGEVIGYSGGWSYQPDLVRIRNVNSGKRRKFRACYASLRSVHIPTAAAGESGVQS